MDELTDIFAKYDGRPMPKVGDPLENLHEFSKAFFADVAEIYDVITRVKNVERNPTGFSLDDAPILGLLVKISKLLREIVKYYVSGDANIVSYLDRQAMEAAVVARTLLASSAEEIANYRKSSFRERLKIFETEEETGFFKTKAGKRLKASTIRQFEEEGLTPSSFELEKKLKWKFGGKSVRDMYESLGMDALYGATYGFGSESIHASWGHSKNFDLVRNKDGTYAAYPIEMPADIRFVGPVLIFCNPAYIGWCHRVGLPELVGHLNWIEGLNRRLFEAFDAVYHPQDG
ncbi:DUF5677 domain-containing protein [Mesorhizobium sp. M0847]|uniref:DUF5677 domain-containing protein n=1 Tax=unclassified Mesorhizobium TaxID=325217 RepID=UPI003334D40D